MAIFEIPDFGKLEIIHLVFDFNGTLACDGILIEGVSEGLTELAGDFKIHIITADTFGKAQSKLEGIPCQLSILSIENQASQKEAYINQLGAHQTIAFGNGRNDRQMLRKAAIGIAILQTEGVAGETIVQADIVVSSIIDALDLIRHPLRLKATLRG